MYTELVPEKTNQKEVFRTHAIEIIVGMALLKIEAHPEVKDL